MGEYSKTGGMVFGEEGEGRGGFRKKNENLPISIPKWIYEGGFIQIGQWENVQKQRGWFWEKGGNSGIGWIKKKNANVTNAIPKYVGSFIQIWQWESVKKIGGIVFGGWGGRIKKKWKPPNFHPKMNLCKRFHPNSTMGKCSKIGGEFGGGGEFRKQIKTSQFPSQNKSIYEVSSKSDNGKGFKNRGKIRERNWLNPKMAKFQT